MPAAQPYADCNSADTHAYSDSDCYADSHAIGYAIGYANLPDTYSNG